MTAEKEREHRLVHTIPPVYDRNARILILGSFPSVKSREAGFYYGHPQNRFWKVLASVLQDDVPEDIKGKKIFLIRHRIALWDVIGSCEIAGSSDASIRNVAVNDLTRILEQADIRAVFVNGKTAERYYRKYTLPRTGRPAVVLPSTSPANAAWNLERLTEAWSRILRFLNGEEADSGRIARDLREERTP